METTRHFVATVYVVCDGATLLHEHERLEMWLPPGGHVDRDVRPHAAAKREVREETGLDVELLHPVDDGDDGPAKLETDAVTALPRPRHLLLEDINVHDGEVGHQHVDFVYYGVADDRSIDPAPGETPPGAWEWFTAAELRGAPDDVFEPDVVSLGVEAIETVAEH